MSSATRWSVARYLGLTLFAIPWVGVPIWMVVANSLKPAGDAAALNLNLPTTWSFADNYMTVLVQGNYLRALANSLIVSLPTILAVALLGAAAAWGFGRSRSKAMLLGYYIVSLSILIPPTIIPTIYVLRALHLSGTELGYILVAIGTRMGVVVFLATGFIRAMPPDLEEAACMDGASRLQIFFLIVLPLQAPVLLVGCIILVIAVWGDFFFASFLLSGSARATLPLALFSFASSSVQSFRWNLVFAHVVLSSLPLILAFMFLQRRIVGGLTEGALKG